LFFGHIADLKNIMREDAGRVHHPILGLRRQDGRNQRDSSVHTGLSGGDIDVKEGS